MHTMNRKAQRQLGIKMGIISTFAVIVILSFPVMSRANIIPTPPPGLLLPLGAQPYGTIIGAAYEQGIKVGEVNQVTSLGQIGPLLGAEVFENVAITDSVYGGGVSGGLC